VRIRTRVKIALALTIGVILAYGAVVLYWNRTMGQLTREVKQANDIVEKLVILRNLTQEYLLYHTERAQRQWATAYDEVMRLLEEPGYQVIKDEYGLGDIPAKVKVVGKTFAQLMAVPESAGPDHLAGELRNRLATQLLLSTYDLLTRFLNLTEEANQRLLATQNRTNYLDYLALLILGLLVISTMVFLNRSVVKPILKLHEGAEKIGAGQLDYKVGLASGDEIGELSQAFDRMSANLKGAADALQQKEERLQSLTSQILTVQEEERARLSRELHDDLGQSLLFLRMQLNAIIRQFNPETNIRQGLNEASTYVLEIIDRVRRTSQALSPSTLSNLGLSEALKSLFEEFQRVCDRDTVMAIDLDEVKDILTGEATIVIYRLIQEFLTNVRKHAEASRVGVAIKILPEMVAVTLEDNGKGFVLEEVKKRVRDGGCLGLISMEERLRMLGSNYKLTSQPGQGTRLYFEIPRTAAQGVAGEPQGDCP
jgi:signal transduction histidine kinase